MLLVRSSAISLNKSVCFFKFNRPIYFFIFIFILFFCYFIYFLFLFLLFIYYFFIFTFYLLFFYFYFYFIPFLFSSRSSIFPGHRISGLTAHSIRISPSRCIGWTRVFALSMLVLTWSLLATHTRAKLYRLISPKRQKLICIQNQLWWH